jgi:hypothetical protein
MNEPEKSDPSIVATKPANKSEGPDAESVERRQGAEGNTNKDRMRRTQCRVNMSSGLERVRERAKVGKKERFTALLHHVNIDLLRAAFSWLKRDAAPGVDGMTWRQYEQNLEAHLVDLHARVHRGAYRAQPSRRKFIPKEDGRERPLGIASLEDKIVQRAVVEVCNAIYEEDFVRRAKARPSCGCESHPATVAPAGSNRSSCGGDETAEAFGVEGHTR